MSQDIAEDGLIFQPAQTRITRKHVEPNHMSVKDIDAFPHKSGSVNLDMLLPHAGTIVHPDRPALDIDTSVSMPDSDILVVTPSCMQGSAHNHSHQSTSVEHSQTKFNQRSPVSAVSAADDTVIIPVHTTHVRFDSSEHIRRVSLDPSGLRSSIPLHSPSSSARSEDITVESISRVSIQEPGSTTTPADAHPSAGSEEADRQVPLPNITDIPRPKYNNMYVTNVLRIRRMEQLPDKTIRDLFLQHPELFEEQGVPTEQTDPEHSHVSTDTHISNFVPNTPSSKQHDPSVSQRSTHHRDLVSRISMAKPSEVLGLPVGDRINVEQSRAAITEEKEIDPNSESTIARNARLRRSVEKELLSSEIKYVTDLEELLETYVRPLESSTLDQQPILPQEDLDVLFSNVEMLYELNQRFLQALRERVDPPTELRSNQETNDEEGLISTVGDLFTSFAPFFKMYTQYVRNHEAAVRLLAEIRMSTASKYVPFKAFLSDAQAASENGKALESYAIEPVQRIPRYELLLKELLKRTDQSHPDYHNLEQALEAIKDAASYINKAVRQQEHNLRVWEIQKQFVDEEEFVKPGREFLREGRLVKMGRSKNRSYYFFLFSDMLVYALRRLTRSGWKYKLHQRIDINSAFDVVSLNKDFIPHRDKGVEANCKDHEDTMGVDEAKLDYDNAFQISGAHKSFVVVALTAQDKEEWMTALKGCMDRQRNLLRRKNSLDAEAVTAPVMQQFTDDTSCLVCHMECTLLNRRHCKKCGHIVHGSCSTQRFVLVGTNSQSLQRVCDKCAVLLRMLRAKEIEEFLHSNGDQAPPVPSRPDADIVNKLVRRESNAEAPPLPDRPNTVDSPRARRETEPSYTPGVGFRMAGIQAAWVAFFNEAGISKDELTDPESAALIFEALKEEGHLCDDDFTTPSPPPERAYVKGKGMKMRLLSPEWRDFFTTTGIKPTDLDNPEVADRIIEAVQRLKLSQDACPSDKPGRDLPELSEVDVERVRKTIRESVQSISRSDNR